LLVGWLIGREIRFRRSLHNHLSRYTEDLRRYAVKNIEPLEQTIAALRDVSVAKPPEEVPTERDPPVERPLGTKERNGLLTLVALLCKEQKIDYTRAAKAAAVLKDLADAHGLILGESTIEGYLKKIPDALEVRAK
jgi:hypothetical protein